MTKNLFTDELWVQLKGILKETIDRAKAMKEVYPDWPDTKDLEESLASMEALEKSHNDNFTDFKILATNLRVRGFSKAPLSPSELATVYGFTCYQCNSTRIYGSAFETYTKRLTYAVCQDCNHAENI